MKYFYRNCPSCWVEYLEKHPEMKQFEFVATEKPNSVATEKGSIVNSVATEKPNSVATEKIDWTFWDNRTIKQHIEDAFLKVRKEK